VKYAWLLVDADGTLFDYDKAESTSLELTFKEFGFGYEPSHADTYRRINSAIWDLFEQGEISQERLRSKRFELLFEALQIEGDAEAFSTRYLRNLAEGSELMEGAEEVVTALHGRVGMMIITNGLADVQRPRFARSAIGDCFADLVISEEVGAAKPHNRIFDIAFEKMQFPKQDEVLIIGDSLSSDIEGGNNYGIDTCWFNPQREPGNEEVEPTYEITALGELLGLVGAA
jgi:YjjG family noncanonical pyrimidine nucleotidase